MLCVNNISFEKHKIEILLYDSSVSSDLKAHPIGILDILELRLDTDLALRCFRLALNII